MTSREAQQQSLAPHIKSGLVPSSVNRQIPDFSVKSVEPAYRTTRHAKSRKDALSPPLTPSLLKIPGEFVASDLEEEPSQLLVSQRVDDQNMLSDPDLTPPTSNDLSQSLHSRQSSTVAESFITANESPWLSRDELLQEDPVRSMDHGLSSSQVDQQAAAAISSVHPLRSARDHIPPIKTSKDRKKAPPANVDVGRARSSSSAAQQIASPRTPTNMLTPVKFSSPKSSRKSGSIASYDSPNRRASAVSSSGSTVIEAIVISAASPKPQKLRHVGKATALRNSNDSSPDQTPSRRAVSDSGIIGRTHEIAKPASPVAIAPTNPTNDRLPVRIVTDPSSTVQKAKTLNGPKTDRSPHELHSVKAHRSPVRSAFVQTHPDIVQPLMYMPLSALPRFPTWSQSLANNAALSYKHRTSSHASRGSVASTATIRSLDDTPQTTVSDIGHYSVDSSIHRQSSTANGSLVTVVRQPVMTPAEPLVESRKSLSAQQLLYNSNESGDDRQRQHQQPTIGATAINADRISDVASYHPRSSSDHLTVRSEDHPKHIISQSTPFSQMSYTPIQLNEATAVNIYPHHNGSILVVDQALKQNQQMPEVQKEAETINKGHQATAPRIAIEPSTPPNKSAELNVVDSPLRNPRAAPPVPPKINVLPATPMRDDDDPLDAVQITKDERPSVMTRARRYSDTLLPSFLTRGDSQRRRHSTMPRARQKDIRDHHLHPKWQPRDFWMNASDSESDWDDEEGVDRLPPGGDTSEPPSHSKFMPRTLSRRLPAFRGTGGFLIGNSLNLERHGTNKRRHYVEPPQHFNGSRVSLRRDSAEQRRPQSEAPLVQSRLRHKTSLSSLRSEQALRVLRAQHQQRRRRRRTWRLFGLELEYVGMAGLRDRWNDQRLAKEHRRAEKRRDELRKSIGPKFLVENQLDSATVASTTTNTASVPSPASTPAIVGAAVPISNARLAPVAAVQA